MKTSSPLLKLPGTMRAAQGKDYGPIDEMLSVVDSVALPRLSDLKSKKDRKDKMLLKVMSVSLAPGDCRVLSGLTRELQGPPSFPYVPGGDCSGVVVELPPDAGEDLPFKVGDPVACRFRGKPMGALGEYAVVSSHTADKLPPLLTFDEGAALAGASPAVVLADRLLESKDKGGASSDAAGRLGRVLVLGARGGVGSHLIQLLKDDHGGKAGTNPGRGASYVVGVSSQPDQLRPFVESGALDEVVDYTQEDVFAMEKFRSEGSKFDLIIDLAGHGYRRLEELKNKRQDLPVKPATEGGRFVTLVPVVGPTYEIHGVLALLRIFAMPLLWKAFTSRTFHRRSLPAYTFALALPDSRECVTRTLDLARTGRLKAIVDGRGPHPFTTEGVREAFRIQESRHATGKTVVRVASPEDGGAKE